MTVTEDRGAAGADLRAEAWGDMQVERGVNGEVRVAALREGRGVSD
jgi:hypothetical protein